MTSVMLIYGNELPHLWEGNRYSGVFYHVAVVLGLQVVLRCCPQTSLRCNIFVNNLMSLYMFFFFPANSLGVGEGKCRNSPRKG